MLVVFDFIPELEQAEPVRIVPDGRRLFILVRSGMTEDEVARHLSVAVTLEGSTGMGLHGRRARHG